MTTKPDKKKKLKFAIKKKEFEDRFGVEAKGDFLIDETPVKLKPDYRKFERFNNDRFKRSR